MNSEIWLPIPGFEGRYEASSEGRLRSLPRRGGIKQCRSYGGKILTPALRKRDGYLVASLCINGIQVQRGVHQLVAEAFYGKQPDGYACCHNDGVKTNCKAENLRWGTPAENSADKALHGVVPLGSRHQNSKLTEELVLIIRDASDSASSLAIRLGVSVSTIRAVRNRATWRHV